MEKTITKLIEKAEKKLNAGDHLRMKEILQLGAVDQKTYQLICDAFALGFYRGHQAKRRQAS